MQLRLTNLLIAFTATLALFATSCKKEFSKDEPFPDVFTPTVFVTSQNQFVYAMDPETGKKKWEYHAGANVQASPVVMGDFVYIAAEDGKIHKLDAKTGKWIRNITVPGQILATPYAEPKGKDGSDYLYIGCGDNNMYCYDVTGDSVEWTFVTGNTIYSSPTISDEMVIFGSYDGKTYSLNKNDGVKIWEFDAGTGAAFYSSPTVADVFVYIGCTNGKLYCLNIADGSLRWDYTTGGPIFSSPISYGGNVIFGSHDFKLYCIDTATAIERWIVPTKDRISSSPYAYNQLIYFGSYDYKMYAVHIIDGLLKWEYETGAIIKSSPMVYDNKLYFGSHDKHLYCLNPANGDSLWTQNVNGLIESSPVVDKLDGKPTYTSSISGNSPN